MHHTKRSLNTWNNLFVQLKIESWWKHELQMGIKSFYVPSIHAHHSLICLINQFQNTHISEWASEVLIIKSCTAKKNTRVPISSGVMSISLFMITENIVNVPNKINSRVYDRPRHGGTKSEFFISLLSLSISFSCV